MAVEKYYRYLALCLIFGNGSLAAAHYKIYASALYKKYQDNLLVEDTYNSRVLRFSDTQLISTAHINPNGIAKIVNFVDTVELVSVSDTLFFDEEFKHSGKVWERTLDSRIDILILLMKILHEKDRDMYPLLIRDFPNIFTAMLVRQNIAEKGSNNG